MPSTHGSPTSTRLVATTRGRRASAAGSCTSRRRWARITGLPSRRSVVLSSLEASSRTSRRLHRAHAGADTRVLDGVARARDGQGNPGRFDDEDTYYRYASIYVPDGEQQRAAGCTSERMRPLRHDQGRSSAYRARDRPRADAFLSRAPGSAAWLNEGLAENTKGRLTRSARPQFTPQQMHDKHLAFWNEAAFRRSGRRRVPHAAMPSTSRTTSRA